MCANLGISVNGKKKQLGCIVDFLRLEFDTLLMEARLPKDKLKKAIEEVARILERKSSSNYEELQSLVGLLSFTAKVVYPGRAFLRRLYVTTDWLRTENICTGLSLLEMIYRGGKNSCLNGLLRSHRQCYSLWTDASGFRGTGGYFLPGHCTLQEFRENIPPCNKICTPSGVTGFSSSEAALLSLDKAFSYRFSMRQRAKRINFKEITAVLQALARWIETFKGSHVHIFCDNFAVTHGLQKNSIGGEAIQPSRRIAMLYAEPDIEVQAHWISTKQNSLADMLSRGQYTKIANKYPSLQIAQTTFGIPLKAGI